MAESKQQKNRFFRLWRRGSEGNAKAARSIAEEGALWAVHGRAQDAAAQAVQAAEHAASSTAKQRATLDAGADEVRAVASRTDDLQRQLPRLAEAFERLNIVALNAGLEGARLGESAGKPLSLVSDEVRMQAERGGEATREIGRVLADCAREIGGVSSRFDDARAHGSDVTQQASVAAASAGDAARALAELGDRLKTATGSDPETAQAIAQATEHARALVTALGALSGRVPRAILTTALRPMLEPLVRSLFEGDEAEEAQSKE